MTGNGTSTLRELILATPRAVLQWGKLEARFKEQLDTVVPEGEKIEMEQIGNNARCGVPDRLQDGFGLHTRTNIQNERTEVVIQRVEHWGDRLSQ